MGYKPCENVDLDIDTENCNTSEEVVTLDIGRLTNGVTTLIINYTDGEDGTKKTLQRPIGRR